MAEAAPPDAARPSALLWLGGSNLVNGHGTLIDDMLLRAGFRDASADYGVRQTGVLPLELVVAHPPQVVLTPERRPGADEELRRIALRTEALRRIARTRDDRAFSGATLLLWRSHHRSGDAAPRRDPAAGDVMRRLPVLVALALVLLIGFGFSLTAGKIWVPLSAWGSGDPRWWIIVELRLPRALLGLAIGAVLGLSGAVLQGYLRNPLADPALIGVSSTAGLGGGGCDSCWGWVPRR